MAISISALVENAVGDVSWLPFVAAVLAAALILLRVLSRSWRSEKIWYQARAAAESVKTMSWKFMMRATPFDADKAEHLFVERLIALLDQLPDQPLTPPEPDAPQVTAAMRAVRAAPLETRLAVYRRDRIADQCAWYTGKSRYHHRRARSWDGAMLVLLLTELVLAVLRISRLNIPVAGLIAIGVATITTWIGARNFESLAVAYSVAAHELLAIRFELETLLPDEQEWSTFVDDAEDAISREHTTWSASRQG
ncbi:MAG: DUF4231 domain-containing protein [Acidimicrobiia bacterium]